MTRLARPLAERFWSKVTQDGDCWVWTASRKANGYGQFNDQGVNRNAHRLAYELMVGAIPDGLELDHLCRNRACVNPYHLDPVTRLVNVQRAADAITHCPQGHALNGRNIYRDPKHPERRACRTCRIERANQRRARVHAAE